MNLTAANAAEVGAVDLSWDAFPGITEYTVGWLANEDYVANRENDEWLKYFAYSNVGDVREWTVRRLTPGIDYWLIACENLNDVAPGSTPQCTSWQRLTLAAGPACPAAEEPVAITPTATGGDYDADNDGLIEIRNLDQLDAIRHDLDGDGAPADDGASAYAAAFPGAANGMGCPSGGCTGYELAADLDYGSVVSAQGWEPIGFWNSSSDNSPFTATFDGNDHSIANLYISRGSAAYVGLFGLTGSGSVIKRIGLTSANVVGGSNVGSLVGRNYGAISDSYVTGGVSGSDRYVGGLVGYNDGSISGSYATSSVAGSRDSVGGLAGYNGSNGAISGNYATGDVSGSDYYVGGLVGHSYGTITASYATGSVTSSYTHVGGLVGLNEQGSISGSYATGSVTSSDHFVGGLVGVNAGAIAGSYATGSASGSYSIGGLVGHNPGSITASYATGATGSAHGGGRVGGLVGSGDGTATASYWNTGTSGLTRSRVGTGLTTAELQTPTGATGIYATWNPNWWDFGTSSQYPVLKVAGLDVAVQRQ